MTETVVMPEEAGQRLDRVLTRLVPKFGLRGRRRLCAEGRVTVNGAPGREAYKVRPGDVVRIVESGLPEEPAGHAHAGDLVRLAARSGHLAALYKPAGLHTESLAGKAADSLQARLDGIVPGCAPSPRLLNRLDFPTSGLVLAALDREGEEQWRRAQDGGQTEKRYLALLEGALDSERILRQRLALKGRDRVLVELAEHPDARRHTRLFPLAVLPTDATLAALSAENGELPWRSRGLAPDRVTLAGCVILKGARHQIRAHASAAGHPLLGDRRYGARWLWGGSAREEAADGPIAPEDERIFLHHGRVTLPGFMAWLAPAWLERLTPSARARGLAWLGSERPALVDGKQAAREEAEGAEEQGEDKNVPIRQGREFQMEKAQASSSRSHSS